MALSTMSVSLLIVLIAAAPYCLTATITAACLALVATLYCNKTKPPANNVTGSQHIALTGL
jgi:hypothetical protein